MRTFDGRRLRRCTPNQATFSALRAPQVRSDRYHVEYHEASAHEASARPNQRRRLRAFALVVIGGAAAMEN